MVAADYKLPGNRTLRRDYWARREIAVFRESDSHQTLPGIPF